LFHLEGIDTPHAAWRQIYQLFVLSKLGLSYSVLVSTFYSIWDALSPNFAMPTFDAFVELITRELDKLIQMGALGSKKIINLMLF